MPRDDERRDKSLITCSFCRKTQDQVDKLIAGPNVYICNECVDLCCSIIESEPSTGRHSDFDVASLPKPHEIKAKLDELEKIVNSKDKKKTKWEKAKNILVWLADKSCDVGMTILPLLWKIQG